MTLEGRKLSLDMIRRIATVYNGLSLSHKARFALRSVADMSDIAWNSTR